MHYKNTIFLLNQLNIQLNEYILIKSLKVVAVYCQQVVLASLNHIHIQMFRHTYITV